MSNIQLNDIIKTYNKIKKLALSSYEDSNYDLSFHYIKTAADFVYKFNWIYVDHELEDLISKISGNLLEKKNYIPNNNHVVFYDYFCYENRGLTQQYIRALISWGIKFLYIYEGEEIDPTNKIIIELNAYPDAEIITLDSGLSKVENLKKLHDIITEFKPQKALLHLNPSNVIGVCLWHAFPSTYKYQINLTDHAFWLGSNCIDYCLEFRNYGYTVSIEKRGLKASQLLIQPYYPITDCYPLQDLPIIDNKNNIVILTGGAYYKMYGENDIFFTILKKLANLAPNVLILIAGNGNDYFIKNYIDKNNLNSKIFLIGNRKDLNLVFEKCDIYLSTFPFTGALMGQLAAYNSKPILSYTSSDIKCNYLEGFLNWNKDDWKNTYTDLDEFFQEARELIYDKSYRIKRGNEAKNNLISENEFNAHLKKLITSNLNTIQPELEDINYRKFTDLYLNSENKYTPSFYSMIFSSFKFRAFLFFPFLAIKGVLSRKIYGKLFNKFKL